MLSLTIAPSRRPAVGFRAALPVGLALAATVVVTSQGRPQDTTATHKSRFATITGAVIDSLHGGPLVNADVEVDGSSRAGRTDADGNFRIDSVPPGVVRLGVFHPLLDSLGVGITSPPLTATPGASLVVTLATPAGPTIAAVACKDVPAPVGKLATAQTTGPAVVLGRVLDADTDQPIANVAVSFVWDEFEANKAAGFHRTRHARQATTGAGGDFRLCHIPIGSSGSLQALRRDGGAAAAAANVTRDLTPHAMLSLVTLHMPGLVAPTIASLAAAATVPSEQPATDAATPAAPSASPASPSPAKSPAASPSSAPSTPVRRYATGAATLTGLVMNPQAAPVENATIYVLGAADSARTDRSGQFALHKLPSGTRMLVVRAIGYEPITQPVELTAREPRRVVVSFTARAVPTLRPVVVTARLEDGLKKVGYDRRRLAGLGTYWALPDIEKHKAYDFHDLFTTFPGLRVDHSAAGKSSLMATRGAGGCIGYATNQSSDTAAVRRSPITPTVGQNCGPCVAFVVDGMPFTESQEGEMDEYVHPQDIGAIEIYQENEAPRSLPGIVKPDCTNIVVWTKAKLGV